MRRPKGCRPKLRDDGALVTTIILRPEFSKEFVDAFMESKTDSMGRFIENLFKDKYHVKTVLKDSQIGSTDRLVEDIESILQDYKIKKEKS